MCVASSIEMNVIGYPKEVDKHSHDGWQQKVTKMDAWM